MGRGEHTREGDAQHISAPPAAAQAAFAHGPRAVLPTDDLGQRVRQEPPTNDEYISAHPTELVAPYLGLKHLFLLTCSPPLTYQTMAGIRLARTKLVVESLLEDSMEDGIPIHVEKVAPAWFREE